MKGPAELRTYGTAEVRASLPPLSEPSATDGLQNRALRLPAKPRMKLKLGILDGEARMASGSRLLRRICGARGPHAALTDTGRLSATLPKALQSPCHQSRLRTEQIPKADSSRQVLLLPFSARPRWQSVILFGSASLSQDNEVGVRGGVGCYFSCSLGLNALGG